MPFEWLSFLKAVGHSSQQQSFFGGLSLQQSLITVDLFCLILASSTEHEHFRALVAMRFLSSFAFAATAALLGRTLAAPVQPVHPGTAQNLIITSKNTINGSSTPISNGTTHGPESTQELPLSFVNNFSGSGSINAYVTGLNTDNQVVFLQSDGSWYVPVATSSTPTAITTNVALAVGAEGTTTKFTLPDYISSARVYFAVGELTFFVLEDESGGTSVVTPSSVNPDDPNAGVNWGFVELTNTADGGLYANISYVDFVGLILGMELLAGDGSTQTAQGLSANAVSEICGALATQGSSDGQPWGSLCQSDSSGNYLRAIAPSDFVSSNTSAFSDYWTEYIDQVWSQYTSSDLTIDTQGSAGNVSCSVSGSNLTCAGDNRGYAKPSAEDIFGCNTGPFSIVSGDNDIHSAVVPRLCAAFDRTTLLLSGGNVQPSLGSSSYYTTSPTNWYSKFVHQYEVDGKGYAFPYDDVNPAGENESGVVSDPSPQLLTVTIGGPSSS
ncbi:MAG: hypothetical protein M1819_006826 [Sarea resinae]|nr:MAG: hypothetical protein M1819_006826 [Sarea resinae]